MKYYQAEAFLFHNCLFPPLAGKIINYGFDKEKWMVFVLQRTLKEKNIVYNFEDVSSKCETVSSDTEKISQDIEKLIREESDSDCEMPAKRQTRSLSPVKPD